MQWFKVDSLLAENEKFLSVDDPTAQLLWFMVGIGCSKTTSDGVIRPHMLKRWGVDAHITTAARLTTARRRLVRSGLWHDAQSITRCDSCLAEFPDLEDDELVMHNWSDWNPTRDDKTDETKAFKQNRARRLKKLSALKEQIRRRDRDYCRYCGIRINMNDRRSTEGGSLDHIDPDGENSLENLVRACRGCNTHRKGERTPAEAGMYLMPPPRPGVAPPIPSWRLGDDPFGLLDQQPKYPRTDPELGEQSESDQSPTREHTPGSKSEPGSDPGSEPDPPPKPGSKPEVGTGLSGSKPPENLGSDPGPPSRDARGGPVPDRTRVGLGSGPGSGPGSEPGRGGAEPAGLGSALLGQARAGSVLLCTDGDGTGAPAPPPDQRSSTTSSDEEPQP